MLGRLLGSVDGPNDGTHQYLWNVHCFSWSCYSLLMNVPPFTPHMHTTMNNATLPSNVRTLTHTCYRVLSYTHTFYCTLLYIHTHMQPYPPMHTHILPYSPIHTHAIVLFYTYTHNMTFYVPYSPMHTHAHTCNNTFL